MTKVNVICDCIIDGANGIYIPQIFAQRYEKQLRENDPMIDGDTIGDITSPDNEFYWESWNTVLDTFNVKDPETGEKLMLCHESDLFLCNDAGADQLFDPDCDNEPAGDEI